MSGAAGAVVFAVATAAWWVALVFLGAQVVVLAVNALTFPRLTPAAGDPAARRRVSLLVPARDEGANLPRTLPGLLQQGAGEVVVLDDGSSDDTPRVLAAFARRHPELRVLSGRPLPAGWLGKSWACQQLAEAARGEVLVFTDADVSWRPGALDAVLAVLSRSGADLVTAWPRQRAVTLGERLSVPQLDTLLLGALPWPLVGASRHPALSAANGQLMAWRRAAYDAVGGHRTVRGEVLEDVALARAAKAGGLRLALRLGAPLLETRMYRSWREAVEGFGKNVLAATGGRRGALLAVVALNVLAHTLCWPLALLEPRWLAVAGLSLTLRLGVELKAGRAPVDAALQPLAPLALGWIAGRALSQRGGVTWKARRYP
ncbi:MAG: glycosyltransferase family 2 protein [Deinococcales bacterium]